MRVGTTSRYVVARLGSACRVLPQTLYVTETLRWKVARSPARPPPSGRREANRGDPMNAQISASSLQFYEKWLEVGREVAAGGWNPARLPPELRQKIWEQAAALRASVALPMQVRSVTILALGHIPANWSAYHSDKYIWPIGFK